jgi:hypothetical protein
MMATPRPRSAAILSLALASIILAGCIGTPAPESLADATLKPTNLPRPDLKVPKFALPVALPTADNFPLPGTTEPNIRTDAEGRVYVATTDAHFWRSLDGGRTFELIGTPICGPPDPTSAGAPCPPGLRETDSGLDGAGDGSVAIGADGRVFWAGLAGETGSVPFQYSLDHGATWSKPFDVADGNVTDREWVGVDRWGTVHVVWRDSGTPSSCRIPVLFIPICPAPTSERILIRSSGDQGLTWSPIREVLDRDPVAGQPAFDLQDGDMYLPINDATSVQVLRSADGGVTWEVSTIPGSRIQADGTALPMYIFPVAAVDSAGTLYVAWSIDPSVLVLPTVAGKIVGVPKVFLATSADKGKTWSEPTMLSPADKAAVLPAIVAGAPGRVAVGWYESVSAVTLPSDTLPNQWVVTLAESTTADQRDAAWVTTPVTPEPIHFGAICTGGIVGCNVAGDRTRGDFFEIALLPNGQPIVAYVEDAVPITSSDHQRVNAVVAQVEDGTPLFESPSTAATNAARS